MIKKELKYYIIKYLTCEKEEKEKIQKKKKITFYNLPTFLLFLFLFFSSLTLFLYFALFSSAFSFSSLSAKIAEPPFMKYTPFFYRAKANVWWNFGVNWCLSKWMSRGRMARGSDLLQGVWPCVQGLVRSRVAACWEGKASTSP